MPYFQPVLSSSCSLSVYGDTSKFALFINITIFGIFSKFRGGKIERISIA